MKLLFSLIVAAALLIGGGRLKARIDYFLHQAETIAQAGGR